MNFKKTIAKSLVVAMALGMVPVANLQTAKAAVPTEMKLTADSFVTGGNAKYWGIAKEAKKAGKDTIHIGDKDYKVTNIMAYPDGGIDAVSALKGKAGTIVLGTSATPSKDDWGKVDIPAADKSLKVQYVADKNKVKGLSGPAAHALGNDEYGYLVGTKVDASKATKEVDLATDAQVKLNDGNWETVAKLLGANEEAQGKKLMMATQVGSTFTFRLTPKDGALGSNDAKVKITPQAKGPSVKFDVNKDSASVKKGLEYQVADVGGNLAGWTKVAEGKKSMTATELNLVGNKAQVLYVRAGATDKKIPSQYTALTFNKRPEALKFNSDKNEDKIEGSKVDIKDSTGAKVLGSIALALGYDLKKGGVLTNASTDDWEYALGKAGPTKWSTLKAPKDVKKPSVAKLKYSDTEKPNTFGAAGVNLYLRVAGTKQTKDGVVTLAGVSVNKEVKLTVVDQKLTLASPVLDGFVDNTSDLTNLALKYKVATGTAAKVTLKGTITKTVKPGTAPKVKLKSGPKLSIKAGKVNADGTFDLTIEATKSTFKTPEDIKDAVFTFSFEGVSKDITVSLTKNS